MVLAQNLRYAYKSADKTKTVLSKQNRTGISYRHEMEVNNPVTLHSTNGKVQNPNLCN